MTCVLWTIISSNINDYLSLSFPISLSLCSRYYAILVVLLPRFVAYSHYQITIVMVPSSLSLFSLRVWLSLVRSFLLVVNISILFASCLSSIASVGHNFPNHATTRLRFDYYFYWPSGNRRELKRVGEMASSFAVPLLQSPFYSPPSSAPAAASSLYFFFFSCSLLLLLLVFCCCFSCCSLLLQSLLFSSFTSFCLSPPLLLAFLCSCFICWLFCSCGGGSHTRDTRGVRERGKEIV